MANDNKKSPAPIKSVPGYSPAPEKKDEDKISTPGSASAPVMPSSDIKDEKPAEQKANVIGGDKNSQNALANFINSDNTDIDNKKDEAKLNDELDWGEEKSQSEEIPEKLKDLPRKYWKHQTV